jgi:hypothetical protein
MQPAMATNETGSAPYISFRTFFNFLDGLQNGLPSRIDRSYWGSKLSGASGYQVVSTLAFLGLIDSENRPTPKLEQLANDPGKRPAILREIILRVYASAIHGLDLQRATRSMVSERFGRAYGLTGSALKKSVSFFLHAATFATIPLAQHMGVRKAKNRRTARKRKNMPTTIPSGNSASTVARPVAVQHELPALDSTLLRGLIERLPAPGAVWAESDRDHWVETLKHIFAIEYRHNESSSSGPKRKNIEDQGITDDDVPF